MSPKELFVSIQPLICQRSAAPSIDASDHEQNVAVWAAFSAGRTQLMTAHSNMSRAASSVFVLLRKVARATASTPAAARMSNVLNVADSGCFVV
jgi:hypothetical protein